MSHMGGIGTRPYGASINKVIFVTRKKIPAFLFIYFLHVNTSRFPHMLCSMP